MVYEHDENGNPTYSTLDLRGHRQQPDDDPDPHRHYSIREAAVAGFALCAAIYGQAHNIEHLTEQSER